MRTRIRAGSPDAFAELFDGCARAVYNHAFRLTAAIGRHGVAVARQNDTDGQRTEWIFDRKTLELLGDRTVQVKADKDGEFKAGTVMSTSAITRRAVVDGNQQTPGKAS